MNKTLPPSIRRPYAQKADPWKLETSPYEDGKYRETTEALPRSRYARGLEIGCSIGVLTSRLAQKCDTLIGLDVSEQAIAKARARCAALPGVSFERRMVRMTSRPAISTWLSFRRLRTSGRWRILRESKT